MRLAAPLLLLFAWSALPNSARAQTASDTLAVLVRACVADPTRCDTAKVPPDTSTKLSNGVIARQSYEWLRAGLTSLKAANAPDRQKRGQLLLDRLTEPDSTSAALASGRARHEADAVLADVEFAKARPSWFAEQWERFRNWLGDHLRTPDGTERGWLRFLLESALFALPLLLLVLWLFRQIREERLRPASPALAATGPGRSRIDWLQLASEHSRRGEWRDAVHALYWHAIGTLEDQRVLAESRTRTPREYLNLLQPGSPRRNRLRELTLLLEVTWYGHREPDEHDFHRAEALAREVADA